MIEFRDMTQEERQALRVERILGGKPEKRRYVIPARQIERRMTKEIAGLKPEFLVERSETGEVKSVRAQHLERYQAAKEAEAREQEQIRKIVMEAIGVEPKSQTAVAEKEQQWRKNLTPETLERLMREMEKARFMADVRAAMYAPHIMPQPLEAPVYELDLEKTCPICGGVKHQGQGICDRCFYRGRARF